MSNKRKRDEDNQVDAAPLEPVNKRLNFDKTPSRPPPPTYDEALGRPSFFGQFTLVSEQSQYKVPLYYGFTSTVRHTKHGVLATLIAMYVNEAKRVCGLSHASVRQLVLPFAVNNDEKAEVLKLPDLTDERARQLLLELHTLIEKEAQNKSVGGVFSIVQIQGEKLEISCVSVRDYSKGEDWKLLEKVS